MKKSFALIAVALGGCPSDGSGDVLWLVPDGSELAVKLVTEPPTRTY